MYKETPCQHPLESFGRFATSKSSVKTESWPCLARPRASHLQSPPLSDDQPSTFTASPSTATPSAFLLLHFQFSRSKHVESATTSSVTCRRTESIAHILAQGKELGLQRAYADLSATAHLCAASNLDFTWNRTWEPWPQRPCMSSMQVHLQGLGILCLWLLVDLLAMQMVSSYEHELVRSKNCVHGRATQELKPGPLKRLLLLCRRHSSMLMLYFNRPHGEVGHTRHVHGHLQNLKGTYLHIEKPGLKFNCVLQLDCKLATIRVALAPKRLLLWTRCHALQLAARRSYESTPSPHLGTFW